MIDFLEFNAQHTSVNLTITKPGLQIFRIYIIRNAPIFNTKKFTYVALLSRN